MTFTDAAREVLRNSGRPLHYKEITDLAIEGNLLSHVGKSPEVTMGARLAATLKKGGDDNPLIRVKPGVFALREWDAAVIKTGLEIKRAPRKKAVEAPPAETPAAAPEAPKAPKAEASEAPADKPKSQPPVEQAPQAPDEAKRAEIAAKGAELFADEDDDDQPILAQPAQQQTEQGEQGEQGEGGRQQGEPGDGGRRRRRRRRRRGGPRGAKEESGSGEVLPSYTTTPAFDSAAGAPRGPQVIELAAGDLPMLDGLAGRSLADAVALIVGTFDRTVGAVSLRQITETAQRRGKLNGDMQLAQSQVAATVRADNSLRQATGMRPRFRMVGGRVGLSDWLIDADLMRAERDLDSAVTRFRELARRSFARKCGELPGHAFVELCVTMLERLGVMRLTQVKFPGASGAEAHFSGVLHSPAGVVHDQAGEGTGLHLAIVIREDGRDLCRERVTELRGAAHHYDSGTMGWILTAGQVLSGAREEAAATGVMPVSLLDAGAIAKLCDEHGVGVVRATSPVALPDVDFFEALRNS